MDEPKSKQQLVEFLRSIQLFSSFDHPTLNKIAKSIKQFSIFADEYLFHQGEAKHSGLYIVVSGNLQALASGDNGEAKVIREIGPRKFMGEIQLLTGQARTADVKATEETRLLFLPKIDFDRIASEMPQILNLLGSVIRKRMRRDQLFQILPNYFGAVNLEQMEIIEKEIEWLHLKSGDMLVQYQDPSDDFYIVVNGKLQARIPDQNSKEHPAGYVLAGESVGEMGFFTNEPRSASVYALRDTDVIRFSEECFHAIQCELPQTTIQFTKQVITKLRHIAIDKSVLTSLQIALVPLSADTPLADFAKRLTDMISSYSRCVHLHSTLVDDILQKEGISQISTDDLNEIRLSTWLDEQEKIFPVIVIYEADTQPSNWSTRCIQRADRVIFAGKANTELDFKFLHTMMPIYNDRDIHKELALLYDQSASQPFNTDRWLDQIGDVQRHYHVRLENDNDYRRMARLLTGKAIGLVLGGGGARGFSHIGVLRAIEEAGLKIDLIGGNSIGALIAAAYASGMGWQEIYKRSKVFASKKKLIDYTFPAVSILAGKSFTAILQNLFGDKKIEDTWIEFFCVSANLTRAQQLIHRRGALWKCVRASSAVFPFFPPVTDGGDLLVDGVLVNNLPLEVMRKICEDCTIIGVDVSTESALPEGYDFDPTLSGWNVLWKKLNPLQSKMNIPGIVNLFMRINEFNSVRQKYRQYNLTNYIVRPDIEGIGVFQFEDFDRIVALGFQAGKQALENWQEL